MTRSVSLARAVATAVLGLILVAITACSSSGSAFIGPTNPPTAPPAATAAPTPTPTPTPTYHNPWGTISPAWTPDPDWTPTAPPWEPQTGDLASICAGHGAPLAPKYTGTSHPVAVLDYSDPSYPEIIGVAGPEGQVQLVVCVGAGALVKVGSCGRYMRASDGVIGYLYKYKQARTATVMVASTGKRLTVATLYGNPASCNDTFSISYSKPPWKVSGGPVTEAQIMAYAKAVSVLKAK